MEYQYRHISSPKCGLIYNFNEEKDHFPEYFQCNDKRFFQIEFKRSREKDIMNILRTFSKLTPNHWSLFQILTNWKPGFWINSENGKKRDPVPVPRYFCSPSKWLYNQCSHPRKLNKHRWQLKYTQIVTKNTQLFQNTIFY